VVVVLGGSIFGHSSGEESVSIFVCYHCVPNILNANWKFGAVCSVRPPGALHSTRETTSTVFGKHFEVFDMFADVNGGEMYTASSESGERQPLLFNAVTNSLQRANSENAADRQTTEYCWRWYMLAVVAVLNLSNGMVSCCVHSSYISAGMGN